MKLPTALTLALLLAACSNDDSPANPLPAGGLYATIAVGSDTFHVNVTHPDGKSQARAYWAGQSDANIPIGDLVCTPVAWNEPWPWHLQPESVRFAEVTIELCDGAPPPTREACQSFGGGQYCPWSAEMTQLRDCDVDPSCPPVPRT